MDEGLVKIILAVIALLSAIITGVVVPYIRSKTTATQRDNIYTIVQLAVGAAEQIYFKPGEGEQKKQYVVNYLSSKGIKLTVEELNIFIESAVKELNIWQEQLLPPERKPWTKNPGLFIFCTYDTEQMYFNNKWTGCAEFVEV